MKKKIEQNYSFKYLFMEQRTEETDSEKAEEGRRGHLLADIVIV